MEIGSRYRRDLLARCRAIREIGNPLALHARPAMRHHRAGPGVVVVALLVSLASCGDNAHRSTDGGRPDGGPLSRLILLTSLRHVNWLVRWI